jgi:hypothetical protein
MESDKARCDDVGVFWDFENVRIPGGMRATFAANCIREVALTFGKNIAERRLYYDSHKESESFTDRRSLDASGFTLVDCPARHAKETLDKKLIVDLVLFALRNQQLATRSTCVVLITSDGDYSYTLSKVRDLGVRTVVIHGPATTTAGILFNVCDCTRNWLTDVLVREKTSEQTSHREQVDGAEAAMGGADGLAPMAVGVAEVARPPDEEGRLSPSAESPPSSCLPPVVGLHEAHLAWREASRSDDDDDDGVASTADSMAQSISDATRSTHLLLLTCLDELPADSDGWVSDVKVSRAFYQRRGVHRDSSDKIAVSVHEKEMYQSARRSAADGRFLERRREQRPSGDGRVHLYLRLTEAGRVQLDDPTEAARMADFVSHQQGGVSHLPAVHRRPPTGSRDACRPPLPVVDEGIAMRGWSADAEQPTDAWAESSAHTRVGDDSSKVVPVPSCPPSAVDASAVDASAVDASAVDASAPQVGMRRIGRSPEEATESAVRQQLFAAGLLQMEGGLLVDNDVGCPEAGAPATASAAPSAGPPRPTVALGRAGLGIGRTPSWCKDFDRSGRCKRGSNCPWAHSQAEMETTSLIHERIRRRASGA